MRAFELRLFLVGFCIIIAGIVLLIASMFGQANISAGGFILIGPFPIVFGTGENATILALISVLVGAIMLILIYVMIRGMRQGG